MCGLDLSPGSNPDLTLDSSVLLKDFKSKSYMWIAESRLAQSRRKSKTNVILRRTLESRVKRTLKPGLTVSLNLSLLFQVWNHWDLKVYI